MRLPRVRLTVRRLMIGVVVAALAFGLLVPAVRILNDPERRRVEHLWQRPDGSLLAGGHEVGFWTQYRRELSLPWSCPWDACRANTRAYREIDPRKVHEVMMNRPFEMMPPPGI